MSQLLPVECDARCRPSLRHNCELFTEQTQITGKSQKRLGLVAQFCRRRYGKYEIIVRDKNKSGSRICTLSQGRTQKVSAPSEQLAST
jgi:hypothetical protein